MFEIKILLGYLSVILGFIAYGLYFNDIFKNRIRPHVFSWLIWGIITGIAFTVQVIKGGGAGAWATGTGSIICFLIGFFAFSRGEKYFSSYDWASLITALLSIVIWFLTNNPTGSVILLSIIDVVGSVPTLQKIYREPNGESAKSFFIHSIKFIIALFALQTYSLTTWLFPATLAVVNAIIALAILIRRRQISVI